MEIHSIYKKTAICTILLVSVLIVFSCIYVVKVTPNHRFGGVVQADEGQIEAQTATENNSGETDTETVVTEAAVADEKTILSFSSQNGSSEYLWIPIVETASASDVVIENHYMDRQLWVSVEGGSTEFYKDNYISGNLDGVISGEITQTADRVILKFTLEHVYEFNTIFENSVLYIEKVSPQVLYDRIVVLDPSSIVPEDIAAENTLSPSVMCMNIASMVKDKLEAEGIHVYITRMDDREVPTEECISLSAEVKPDMFVRIETSFNEDSKKYGTETVYNGTFFIPGFGSVELADLLEAHVTTSIGGLAGGLVDATDEDVVIRNATVPAASVKVGYFTNAQENILLNREDYRTKIAQGIADAIIEAFERKDG